jgi:serine/threonine-protein kinase
VLIPLKVKNYWLYFPLGGGGMGSVYKAVSVTGEGKEYAVKVLPRAEKTNQDFIKAIMHEGKAGSTFGSHVNIIGIVEYGVDGDEHFLVTEFIDGDRLDLLVGAENRIPEKRAILITLQILEAEMHILKCGYLFRDLKPQNIIIDKSGTSRLFDYGLCATPAEAAEANLADDVQGSPFYIPPERIVGAPEAEYSEIYSLGMILFYMLSGRTYYSQAEVNELVSKHLTSLRALSVETYLKDCNPKCIAIIDRMIARNPEKRYQDFNSLKADLEQIYSQLKAPVVMIPPVISKAFKKSFGKKARLVGIVSAVLFSLAIIAGLAAWGYSVHRKIVAERQAGLRLEKLSTTLAESAAKELGVPADIKAPSLTPDEINKKINEAAKAGMALKTSEVQAFNEQETRKSICKTLNISPDDKPTGSIDEIKKKMQNEIRDAAENEIRKIDRKFNEDSEIKRIASELKIELPLKDPAESLKEVDAEFKSLLQQKLDDRFPPKAYSSKLMEIQRKYSGYRKGDNVEVTDASGISIKGSYAGKVGNKIIIGERQVLISDLSGAERWKFNEAESELMIQKMVDQFKDEFKKNKDKYAREIETAEKTAFYGKYGYLVSKDGSCKSVKETANGMLRKAKDNFQNEINKKEKSIRDAAEAKFDKNAYMKKNHLREIDGAWRTEAEVLDKLLAKEKEIFESRRKTQLDSIRESAYADAEKQVYTSNGYVFSENKWQPARKLIDDIVANKIKEEKK